MSANITRSLSRHVTASGGNSLKAHLFGPRTGEPLAKKFFTASMNNGTWPLLLCVGGAMGLTAWFGTRHLMYCPDVRISKVQRTTTLRQNHEEGRKWVQSHASMRNLAPGAIAIRKVD